MSETKNLKLKKHDNVATNTNAFDIENHLNKNWDILDLEDEVVNEKIEDVKKIISDLQEENETIKSQFPKITTEKAEMIHLTDSSNLKAKISIFGNSAQEIKDESPSSQIKSEITTVKDNIKITKSNANLFDKNNINVLKSVIPNNETGKYQSTGYELKQYYIKCKPNTTYTISKNVEGGRVSSSEKEPADNVPCKIGDTFKLINNKHVVTITTGETDNFLSFTDTKTANAGNYNVQEFLDSVQIENSSESTEYVPHKEEVYNLPLQKEFCKIGTYQDTFVKKSDGNWYERHVIKSKIYDGTENCSLSEIDTSYKCTRFKINYQKNIVFYVGLNNYFINRPKGESASDKECAYISESGYSYYEILRSSLSEISPNGFKEFLTNLYNAGNPMIQYYVLITPEDILCTAEQTAVLDELEATPMYKNETVITTDSIAEIQVEYYRDLETLLKKAGAL